MSSKGHIFILLGSIKFAIFFDALLCFFSIFETFKDEVTTCNQQLSPLLQSGIFTGTRRFIESLRIHFFDSGNPSASIQKGTGDTRSNRIGSGWIYSCQDKNKGFC